MNGMVIESHVSIVEASGADAVIVGSVAVETAQLGRPFTIQNEETEFQRALANRDEHEHTRREATSARRSCEPSARVRSFRMSPWSGSWLTISLLSVRVVTQQY